MPENLSMDEIYRLYEKKVHGYIAHRVNNFADAQELSSEVFTKVFCNLALFNEEKATFSTWLYTICRNTVYDYFRRNAQVSFQEEAKEAEMEALSPEALLLQKEQLGQLANALEKLPERERDIVILRFYHDLPAKTVAEKMGLSYANTRYLQTVALKKLRKYLQEENEMGCLP